MKWHTFRDDDISVTTDWRLLDETHALIVRHGRTHTVAVQMERLWENKEVWFWLMRTKGLVVGLHGWRHDDYSRMNSDAAESWIHASLKYWQEHTGAYPNAPKITTFYPPWNRVGPDLEAACSRCGLTLDARWKKDTGVYGFHSWEMQDPERWKELERALKA